MVTDEVVVKLGSFSRNPPLINSSTANITIDNFERQFLRVLNKVYQTIERNEVRLAEQDRRDAIKLEWQQVALVIDRFSPSFLSSPSFFASFNLTWQLIYVRENND